MTAATVHATDGWTSADAWAALHRAETSPHDLAAIAAAFPHYAEQIARHPRAYPALIEWAGVVAAGRRGAASAVGSPAAAGSSDMLAAGRRESGAHPLAFSADAEAWRAAVAAGAALTQGSDRVSTEQTHAVARPVPWTPSAPQTGSDATLGARPADAAHGGTPWWADVTPAADVAAADVTPAPASAPAAGDRPTGAVNSKALLGFVFAFVLAPLGIVFAHLALRELAATGEAGRGYARAGLIIGYAIVGGAVLAAAVALSVVLSG